MSKIYFYGWNHGLQKVSVTHLFRSSFGCSLKEAKELTDKLLDRKEFTLACGDEQDVTALLGEFLRLGVNCKEV
jgi:hypothetical protein